jgi:hypothetical protein
MSVHLYVSLSSHRLLIFRIGFFHSTIRTPHSEIRNVSVSLLFLVPFTNSQGLGHFWPIFDQFSFPVDKKPLKSKSYNRTLLAQKMLNHCHSGPFLI